MFRHYDLLNSSSILIAFFPLVEICISHLPINALYILYHTYRKSQLVFFYKFVIDSTITNCLDNEDRYNDTYGSERMYMALKLKSQAGETDVINTSPAVVSVLRFWN